MKRCVRCGLPAAFPGITYNKQTVCNYCVCHEIQRDRETAIKSELAAKFLKLINKTNKQDHKYDGIVAYSGGKDSSFLLYYLKKELKMNILAHTLDNGFTSEAAMRNIKTVTQALDIDSRITRPDMSFLKDVFSYALTEKISYPNEVLSMMSQVCAVCIGMVLGTTLNLASKLRIPLMFIGFTPGQYPIVSMENYMKLESCIFLSSKVYRDDPMDIMKIIADPIRERFGEKVNKYFMKSQYIPEGTFMPKVLFPYHSLLDYNESYIYKKISEIGWKKPTDTDSCSTNCLLNCAGNYSCVQQSGYHPYEGELSYLVREGKMDLARRLSEIEIDESFPTLERCLKTLGLNKQQLKGTVKTHE